MFRGGKAVFYCRDESVITCAENKPLSEMQLLFFKGLVPRGLYGNGFQAYVLTVVSSFFLYKIKFYKNIEAQNRQRTMEI